MGCVLSNRFYHIHDQKKRNNGEKNVFAIKNLFSSYTLDVASVE